MLVERWGVECGVEKSAEARMPWLRRDDGVDGFNGGPTRYADSRRTPGTPGVAGRRGSSSCIGPGMDRAREGGRRVLTIRPGCPCVQSNNCSISSRKVAAGADGGVEIVDGDAVRTGDAFSFRSISSGRNVAAGADGGVEIVDGDAVRKGNPVCFCCWGAGVLHTVGGSPCVGLDGLNCLFVAMITMPTAATPLAKTAKVMMRRGRIRSSVIARRCIIDADSARERAEPLARNNWSECAISVARTQTRLMASCPTGTAANVAGGASCMVDSRKGSAGTMAGAASRALWDWKAAAPRAISVPAAAASVPDGIRARSIVLRNPTCPPDRKRGELVRAHRGHILSVNKAVKIAVRMV
jgi:hypothetical protein